MSIKNIEIQDNVGNVYYPHTDASIVKFGDSDVGSALSERMQDIFSITKNINGKNIKIIGDSITSGVRGTGFNMDGEQFYQTFKENTNGHCWANSLKQYLSTNSGAILWV